MADARFVTKAVQCSTGVARVDGRADFGGDRKIEVAPHVVSSLAVGVLPNSMTLKCRYEGVGHRKESSRSGSLRLAKSELVLLAFERPAYAERSLVKVDVAPLQAENFAGPSRGEHEQQVRDLCRHQRVGFGPIEVLSLADMVKDVVHAATDDK
jgi:hypothetical protein